MTTATRIPATNRVPMDSLRKTAFVAGVFYLITFISIPTLCTPRVRPRKGDPTHEHRSEPYNGRQPFQLRACCRGNQLSPPS
jgi:hypothetical protein